MQCNANAAEEVTFIRNNVFTMLLVLSLTEMCMHSGIVVIVIPAPFYNSSGTALFVLTGIFAVGFKHFGFQWEGQTVDENDECK